MPILSENFSLVGYKKDSVRKGGHWFSLRPATLSFPSIKFFFSCLTAWLALFFSAFALQFIVCLFFLNPNPALNNILSSQVKTQNSHSSAKRSFSLLNTDSSFHLLLQRFTLFSPLTFSPLIYFRDSIVFLT